MFPSLARAILIQARSSEVTADRPCSRLSLLNAERNSRAVSLVGKYFESRFPELDNLAGILTTHRPDPLCLLIFMCEHGSALRQSTPELPWEGHFKALFPLTPDPLKWLNVSGLLLAYYLAARTGLEPVHRP